MPINKVNQHGKSIGTESSPRTTLAKGRSASASRLGPEVTLCKFSIPLPENSCVFEYVTRKYPDVTIHYLSAMITGKDELTSDAEMLGPSVTGRLNQEMMQHEGTKRVEVLSFSEGHGLYRIVEPLCPSIQLLRDLKLLPRYPFPIVKTRCNVVIAGTEAQIRELYARLKESVPGTVILSVRHGELGAQSILTPRQLEAFRKAVSAGYYDVPRRTSLKDLADFMGVSKSSLWETMATVERKLLTTAADGSPEEI